MDLISRLRGWAVARPRVLLVDSPGTVELRWAVEAELARRGWSLALSPADTDILLVLGTPGPQLSDAVDLLWSQVPEPRHRLVLATDAHVRHQVDVAARALVGAAQHPEQTTRQPDRPHKHMDQSGMARHEGMDHSGVLGHECVDHSGMAGIEDSGHEGMDHSATADMDHSGMGGGDHAGHHMHHGGEVAGLAMAETAPDRDGLALDVLRVSLGPVLHGWPTGLLLRADLQGDVLTGVHLSWVDSADHRHPDPGADPQRNALDHLAALLSVSGWPTAARDARRVRDGLASEDPDVRAVARNRAKRLARRVRRSRALAWSLRGAGRLEQQLAMPPSGDVLERVRRWCDVAAGGDVESHLSPAPLDAVAAMVDGTELAAARLIVASVALAPSALRVEPDAARA